jgi:hypothetical protein
LNSPDPTSPGTWRGLPIEPQPVIDVGALPGDTVARGRDHIMPANRYLATNPTCAVGSRVTRFAAGCCSRIRHFALRAARIWACSADIWTLPVMQERLRLSNQVRTGAIYPASFASVDAGPDDFRSRAPRNLVGDWATGGTIRLVPRWSDLLPSASTL